MTVRMVVYYKPPSDPEAFERRYIEGHLPLIERYEKIQSYTFNKVSRVVMGEFPYAYTFLGIWANKDDWKTDLGSEQAKAAAVDAQEFATQGFDVILYEELA